MKRRTYNVLPLASDDEPDYVIRFGNRRYGEGRMTNSDWRGAQEATLPSTGPKEWWQKLPTYTWGNIAMAGPGARPKLYKEAGRQYLTHLGLAFGVGILITIVVVILV